LLVLVFSALGSPLCSQRSSEYKRGQDPLILCVKRIALGARQSKWDEVLAEAKRLDWQFQELRRDLKVDVEKEFLAAVASQSMNALSREVSRLLYHAIEQKLYWNEVEELKPFSRAKSRLDATLYYYEEVLAPGVKRYDEVNKKAEHLRILEVFTELRRSCGSPGLFGLQARPPELDSFRHFHGKLQGILQEVYPHLRPQAKAADAETKPQGEPPSQPDGEPRGDGKAGGEGKAPDGPPGETGERKGP
jgi:hypothetical protein